MRNHNEKARDMERSVLPSTARKGSRDTRRIIHRRERAHERYLIQQLRRCPDIEDFDENLTFSDRHRRDIAEMVEDRRSADKVGPLVRWAERKIEQDSALAAASFQDREVHFAKLLPPGLIGDHALFHLRWVLDDRPPRWLRVRRDHGSIKPDVEMVNEIIAAGRHGDLNRRIRVSVAPFVVRTVRLGPERVIDEQHPAPGVLLPHRTVTERRRREVRFLEGAHDVEAFVRDADWEVISVVRAFHAEASHR